MYPLQFTGLLNKVDIVATVERGGFTGQSGAIRYGISRALRSLVDEDTIEDMRVGEFWRFFFFFFFLFSHRISR